MTTNHFEDGDLLNKKYYTTSDVAKICNVHRNTIIGSIRKGILKIYRTPGGHARIAREDLLEFCKRRNLPVSFGGSRNDKVLVVDDDPLLVRLIKAGLEKAGYRVVAAANGYDAGFMTLDFKPDVMLLDIMLPDVDGDKVAQRIRSSPQTEALPILGISAVTDQNKIDKLMEAGVNDFLPKPFEVSDLIKRIQKLIGTINTNIPIEQEAELVS